MDPTYGQLFSSLPTEYSLYIVTFFHAEYVDDLIRETVSQTISTTQSGSIPPALCSQYEKPDKDEAVSKHRSRFQHL